MKRRLGQHFLFDRGILKKIIDSGSVTPQDTVVEIGPGTGVMTAMLAERAGKVIAIELDRKLFARLEESLSAKSNVELINADALGFHYETIQGKFKVIANIPYYITTPLIFKLLEFKAKIPSMTLLMQKEVGRRITALPGTKEYGVLSISTQLYTKPSIKFLVPKGAFSPPPKVDSALVYFEVSPEPFYRTSNEKFLIAVVRKAFSQRRKTILNSLKCYQNIREALLATDIDSRLRPEVLSIKDFIKLAEALQAKS